MILTEKVTLTINNRYVKFYKSKGYNIKGGQTVEIKIEDLSMNSNIMISVECDCCKEKKEVMYVAYNRYTKNQIEEYYCQKCNNIKRKITVKEKYGVDNILESDIIKDKVKKTMIEKYGNEHALNVPELKEKARKTNNKKFGCDFASQNDEIKEKIKKTFLKNYGVTTSLLNPETQDKISKTNIEKYGVDNVLKLKNFREDGLFEIYGVKCPFHSIEIKEKMKETNLIKYGCENPMSNKEIKDKMIKTKQKLGIYLQDYQRDDFTNYRLKVKSLTNKNKKLLYENWNGLDFYDNEYIKNNSDQRNKKYPTIDHKISVKYGFDNNMSPEEIAEISNLCITKRCNNSSKGSRCR